MGDITSNSEAYIVSMESEEGVQLSSYIGHEHINAIEIQLTLVAFLGLGSPSPG